MKYQTNRFDKIVLEIEKNPGIRFRELARICHIPNSTMTYYTNKLEKKRIVKVRKKANECRFFPKQITSHEKTVIITLRKRSQRNILLLLLKKERSFSDIYKTSELAPSTISAKLTVLTELGLVKYTHHGKLKKFRINNAKEILGIVKKYHPIIKITEP